MEINEMTRQEIERVQNRKWNEDIGEFDSLIILPMEDVHDSGFRVMDFVAVADGMPLRRLSGCSDVLHLDGIGGFGIGGINRYDQKLPKIPAAWSIDCLKISGLIRLFTHGKLIVDDACSSMGVYNIIKQ